MSRESESPSELPIDASRHVPAYVPVAWRLAIVIVGIFVLTHFSAVPQRQALLDNVQWTLAHLGAVLLAWLGVREHADADRPARRWFMLALMSYGIGQVVWDIQIYTGWTPFPAPSDLFYAACGPLMAMGIWQSLRQRITPQRARSLLLDLAILLIQASALVLVLYLSNVSNLPWLQLVQLAIYPIVMFGCVLMVLVLALELGLGLSASWRWLVLPTGLALTGAAWMRWNLIELAGTPADGTWLNFSFAVASWLNGVGAACWQIDAPLLESDRRRGAIFLLMPVIMVIVAVVSIFLVWNNTDLPSLARGAVLVGEAVVIILSVVRQGFWLSERERLLAAESDVAAANQQYKVLAQRFQLATSAAHMGIWDIDLTQQQAIWDERMYEIYGQEAGCTTAAYSVWERSVHPDDMQKVRNTILQAAKLRIEMHVEFRIINPAGELRYLEAFGVTVQDEAGHPVRMTGANWDVTDRVIGQRALAESEAELSAIFENSVIGIALLASDTTIIRTNRAARQLLGYSLEQVAKLHSALMIHPDDRQQSLQMFGQLLSGELLSYQAERRYLRADGESMWVRVTVYPVTLKDTHDFVCLIEDISQRKQMEEDLREVQRSELQVREEFSYQLLTAQEQERQRIANELHDSIGQSLSLIKNRAVLAMEQAGSSVAVLQQLDGMLKLTTDAIIEVRGLAHNLRPMHIEELGLTISLRSLLEQFAQSSGLVVDSRLENVDDVFSREQLTHVYRIVQESLNNILKHAASTRVSVIVEHDLSVVRIIIRDDGRGFVVNKDTERTGLGLTSIKERAHMLGGTLQITSMPGAGTRLQIELPIRDQSGLHDAVETVSNN